MPLNEIEKRAISEIPRKIINFLKDNSPFLIFVFWSIVILSLILSQIGLNLQGLKISGYKHSLESQSDYLKAQLEQTKLVTERLNDLQSRIDTLDTRVIENSKHILNLNQDLNSLIAINTKDHDSFFTLLNKIIDKQRELFEKQADIFEKQAEMSEKLEGIKAVVRRGNLLLPEVEK